MNTLLYLASAMFVALSVMDLLQSLKLQKMGAIERNPILGKRPKPAVLIAFAVVTTALWLWAAVFFVTEGVTGAWAIFGLGIFLRAYVVVRGKKLEKKLNARLS